MAYNNSLNRVDGTGFGNTISQEPNPISLTEVEEARTRLEQLREEQDRLTVKRDQTRGMFGGLKRIGLQRQVNDILDERQEIITKYGSLLAPNGNGNNGNNECEIEQVEESNVPLS